MKPLLTVFLSVLSLNLGLSTWCRADPQAAIPFYDYKVVATLPHDPSAFTEGFFFRDGYFYESTGLEGHSSWRKVKPDTGEVVLKKDLPKGIFGEGIIDWNSQIVGLTWKTQIGYVGSLNNLAVQRQFAYPGEGWGMTRNDTSLFMSDGTSSIRVLDPKTLKIIRRINVTADGSPVEYLNELEWVEGELYANIWQSSLIARIDPNTGKVTGWINLEGLLGHYKGKIGNVDVANGIAYDAETKRLFVTGKLWPVVFEIKLVKSAY